MTLQESSASHPGLASEIQDGARHLLVTVEDGMAWITLNRPSSLNAMNVEMMDGLLLVLDRLAADSRVRCVGLRGAGRAFCAGGDVNEILKRQKAAGDASSTGALIEQQYRTMIGHVRSTRLLHEMPKPTIAAVHGHAVGGGLSLALACDIRVVAETARLRVGFAARSLSGDFGISHLLTHVVGGAKARELMLLDPVVDGVEAARIGLATRVCSDDQLADVAGQVGAQLASGPTIAFGRMKDNLLAAETMSLEEFLRVESMNQRVSASTADAVESGRAFFEGRPPKFTGT